MDLDKLNRYLVPMLEKPSSKKWNILKIERHSSTSLLHWAVQDAAPRVPIREPFEMRDALKMALKPLFKTVIYVKEHDGALWAAVDLLSVGSKTKEMVFIVHYPHADFVFLTALKTRTVTLSLHEALCDVFNCEKLRTVNCVGSNLLSMTDIALYPLSQGSFGAYRLYKTLLDSNLFDEQEQKRDVHRQVRVDEGLNPSNRQGSNHVSPTTAKRFVNAAGTGIAVDPRLRQQQQTQTTGVLTKEQSKKITSGTRALSEIKLVVDHDLRWNDDTIPFACTVTVKGENIMHSLSGLQELGMVVSEQNDQGEPSKGITSDLGDASNVIQDALEASEIDRKRHRRQGAGENNRKLVRTVGVRCS